MVKTLALKLFREFEKQIDENEVDKFLGNKKQLREPYMTQVRRYNKGGMLSFLLGVVFMIINN